MIGLVFLLLIYSWVIVGIYCTICLVCDAWNTEEHKHRQMKLILEAIALEQQLEDAFEETCQAPTAGQRTREQQEASESELRLMIKEVRMAVVAEMIDAH